MCHRIKGVTPPWHVRASFFSSNHPTATVTKVEETFSLEVDGSAWVWPFLVTIQVLRNAVSLYFLYGVALLTSLNIADLCSIAAVYFPKSISPHLPTVKV